MGITSKRYHWTVAQKQEMRSLYEEGYSYVDIAKRFGCQCETIRYHLQRMGVAARGVGMQTEIARKKYSGDKHHGWNGGTFIDHGYRKVLAPSHPFKDNDGYVAEHRLVVENHLQNAFPQHPALRDDGFLKPDWIVHHQDHNKLEQ